MLPPHGVWVTEARPDPQACDVNGPMRIQFSESCDKNSTDTTLHKDVNATFLRVFDFVPKRHQAIQCLLVLKSDLAPAQAQLAHKHAHMSHRTPDPLLYSLSRDRQKQGDPLTSDTGFANYRFFPPVFHRNMLNTTMGKPSRNHAIPTKQGVMPLTHVVLMP